ISITPLPLRIEPILSRDELSSETAAIPAAARRPSTPQRVVPGSPNPARNCYRVDALRQRRIESRPLAVNPSADGANSSDDGDHQNAQQHRVFDQGRAVFVPRNLLQQIKRLYHVDLLLGGWRATALVPDQFRPNFNLLLNIT